MSRTQSFMDILAASARMHSDISMILEAKASEAEKSRDWILNHLSMSSFDDYDDQLAQPLDMHEQFVELLDGLTKMESALAKNLKIVLNKNDSSDDFGGFGGMGGGELGGFLGGGDK